MFLNIAAEAYARLGEAARRTDRPEEPVRSKQSNELPSGRKRFSCNDYNTADDYHWYGFTNTTAPPMTTTDAVHSRKRQPVRSGRVRASRCRAARRKD